MTVISIIMYIDDHVPPQASSTSELIMAAWRHMASHDLIFIGLGDGLAPKTNL